MHKFLNYQSRSTINGAENEHRSKLMNPCFKADHSIAPTRNMIFQEESETDGSNSKLSLCQNPQKRRKAYIEYGEKSQFTFALNAQGCTHNN